MSQKVIFKIGENKPFEEKVAFFRDIVSTGTFGYIGGTQISLNQARVILAVYDNLDLKRKGMLSQVSNTKALLALCHEAVRRWNTLQSSR